MSMLDLDGPDLFMIEEINVEHNTMTLSNYIFNKKRMYEATSEEIEYYQNLLWEAWERCVFLFVLFDDKKGVILQN